MAFWQQLDDAPKPGDEDYSLLHSVGDSLSNVQFWVKVGVLIALSPFWWPVLKAMYQEVQATLRKEGGLFGKKPTPRELKEMEDKHGIYESPLISIPRHRPGERSVPMRSPGRRGSAGGAAAGGEGGRARRGGGPVRSGRPRGF